MFITRCARGAALVALAVALPVSAQAQGGTDPRVPTVQPKTIKLSGPRFGMTFLSDKFRDSLKTHDIEVGSTISQFGWQFEKQFYSKEGGPSVLNERVLLAGGLDQGLLLPSLNWMVGLRTRDGAEFGIGPNISPAGVALAMAAGVTFRAGVLNIPMNFAVVPSKEGMRVSMLTGFTLRK